MSREIYDEQVLPKLMEVGKLCEKLGFPLLAMVQFDDQKDLVGKVTVHLTREKVGPRLRYAALAANASGDLDEVLYKLRKDARLYGHSSRELEEAGIPRTLGV